MRTIFALFESCDEAKAAVAELIDRHFDEGEMNVIVREPAAQTGQDAKLKAANKAGSPERAVLQGIDRVLMDGTSVIMPDVGAVRVAGKIAAMTAGAAMAEKPRHDLKDILSGLGVPEELAEFYHNGVLGGGFLFWVRTDDGRAGEATNVLSSTRAEKLADYDCRRRLAH
jgi:hypothetical protein